MKISDGFDAKRLRPRTPRNWGMRLAAAFSALLATAGVLLAMAGAASLLGRPAALGELNANPAGASVLLGLGLLLLYLGIWFWRRSRLRLRRRRELNLSPHLMKKHD
ncbi:MULTISPECIES: hypothetical protein [Pseudomonas]|uniref:Uncharacterized protein n=2 Tax=Pseudomonas TaxID=286 RepID=A0A411MM77_9PSED|nr:MULTISPECIES: hypothetical protein [Pseudomonas]MDD1014900.1 hypothetical protein [Pseudomonas rubra]MDD1040690.1 hypothetical protein [Pseudomonas rubra]MDD1156842.1 hypothetical protein [Pseudomonas rubra]QBF27901.1 hypothetical protein EXN22_20255 [Pseudomonas tructae]